MLERKIKNVKNPLAKFLLQGGEESRIFFKNPFCLHATEESRKNN